MRDLARVRRGLPWVISILGVLGAVPASAAILESYAISNSYGYTFNNDVSGSVIGGTLQPGGSVEQHFLSNSTPDGVSELGVNYTAVAGDGGFYFLHQDYCAGTCSVASKTVIDVTLTNTDSAAANLRFDSVITPGHMALNGPSDGMLGSYNFTVQQIDGSGTSTLFASQGNIIPDGPFVEPGNLDGMGGGDFNGRTYTNPAMSNWATINWGVTNLSVPMLTIDAGASVTLRYIANYDVRNNGLCDDLGNCSSLEIVFGDPRNDGSIIAERAAFMSLASTPETLSKALIGGAYDPYFVPFTFVPIDGPPQDPQDLPPEITYDSFFKSNATTNTDPSPTPEPATWATMLCGFALTGTVMRRRRKMAAGPQTE